MINKKRFDDIHESFNNRKTIIDLRLNNNERAGDILFLIGTIIAIISTDQTEKELLEPSDQANNAPKERSQALITLALASWIFFIASFIFAFTALERLKEQSKEQSIQNTNSNTGSLFGLTITTIGDFFKVVGFGLAAIGNQIRANSSSQQR